MKNTQYTIRRVPLQVDQALREKARQRGCSLNEVALQALRREAGLSNNPVLHDDLDHLSGSWKEDPDFDRAMQDLSEVDPEDWKL